MPELLMKVFNELKVDPSEYNVSGDNPVGDFPRS